jgi:hypothetical protein
MIYTNANFILFVPMTLQQFNTISQHREHRNLLLNGAFIGNRITEECNILLFQVHNQYVELFLNMETNQVLHARNFDSTDELTPYLNQIDLSGIN